MSTDQKWARNLFWGEGRDYDPAWAAPRTDEGDEIRRRLFYDIATRIQPRISRGIRIIGGDVIPGVSDYLVIARSLVKNKYSRNHKIRSALRECGLGKDWRQLLTLSCRAVIRMDNISFSNKMLSRLLPLFSVLYLIMMT